MEKILNFKFSILNRREAARGFTLIETLIAGVILALIIGSAVTLGNLAIRGTVIGVDRTQAYNLAQEGAELVREIRDTAWLDNDSSTGWSSILSANLSSYKLAYTFDLGSNNYIWRVDPGAENITLDNVVYKRSIFVEGIDWYKAQTGIDNSRIKKIRVSVEWVEFGQPLKIELVTYLTDWTKEI